MILADRWMLIQPLLYPKMIPLLQIQALGQHLSLNNQTSLIEMAVAPDGCLFVLEAGGFYQRPKGQRLSYSKNQWGLAALGQSRRVHLRLILGGLVVVGFLQLLWALDLVLVSGWVRHCCKCLSAGGGG